MKIVLLDDSHNFWGVEHHILDLAKGLRDQKIDVHICCPSRSPLQKNAEQEKIATVHIEKEGFAALAYISTLCRLLKAHNVDIIHAHNGWAALFASIAILFSGRGKLVFTQHFITPRHISFSFPKRIFYRIMHKWVNGRIDRFIAISEAVRRAMIERRDAAAEKISLIPNGIKPPDSNKIIDPDRIRVEAGVRKEDPFIVCVSRLEAEKNIISLIAAMPEVISSCPEAKCVIAGEGNQKDKLLDKIKELKLKSAVRLVGFYADAASLINAGDIFVLPSPAEPFGLVLLEAMALAKPVVAVRAGGPAEIVVNEQTGLLVNTPKPCDITDAILRLLKNSELRREMGINGLRRFNEKYTVIDMVNKTIAVYGTALEVN